MNTYVNNRSIMPSRHRVAPVVINGLINTNHEQLRDTYVRKCTNVHNTTRTWRHTSTFQIPSSGICSSMMYQPQYMRQPALKRGIHESNAVHYTNFRTNSFYTGCSKHRKAYGEMSGRLSRFNSSHWLLYNLMLLEML